MRAVVAVGAEGPVDAVLAARAELLASDVGTCCAAASAATVAVGATVAAVGGALVCSKCRWAIFRKHSLLPGLQLWIGFVSLHVATAFLP